MKRSKRYREAEKAVEKEKQYLLEKAVELLKSLPQAKFDETVEISVKLTADPKRGDQVVRGSARMPKGTGKTKRVVVFCEPEKEAEAKEAGADFAGGKELIDKVSSGWLEFDYCISTPSMMRLVSRLGRILGPRGLMPSPKTGSVTDNLAFAVKEAKGGKIDFRMDKTGCVNVGVAKLSFPSADIVENANAFLQALVAAKPAAVKGKLIKSVSISATMSPGLKVRWEESAG